ncbi:hypothetical protein GGGNBK_21620 [Sporosarcina sp. ANT_H38]|nr:hypothetical protein [Sporosarcina sp. ANT_H38]
MLTLAEKGQIALYFAPFVAFYIGILWQHATWELEQEEGENDGRIR